MIKPTVAEAPLEVAATAENIAASTPKSVIVPENQPHLTVGDEASAASDDAFAAQKQAEYDAQVAEQMTAPKLAETPTATTDEELATLAKKAALGSIGKDKAQNKLAEQVAINPETKAAADNLGFDLESDQMTTNDQFRRLVGLARSEAGSTAEARGYQSVKNSADVADTVMADLDGTTDLSLVNQKIKSTLGQTRDSLETEAKTLYNKIDEKILPETPVEMANLKEVLDKTLTGLGGKEGMTSEENRLLKLVKNKPTYLALTREKQLIGNALDGKASPYGNTAEGTLKQLYGALARDQHAAIVEAGGDDLGNQFRIANQLTAKRKALEKRIVNAFGKDRDGSVASAIKSSISTATKGNDAGLAKVLKVVPDDLKKQTLASAIYSLSKEGEQFNFNTYANLYRGLRRNSVAYNTVVKNMGGKETDKILTDLFQVSQGIAKAQSSVLQNGKANQAMLKQLKGAESLIGKVLETTKDAAVKGLAYEAVTSAVGAHGIGLASGITHALASSKTNAVRAVGDVITSPEFKALVEEVATKGKGSPQNIKRVANHWKMRKLGKIVGGELAKPPKDVEKWIIQSIQAANEEKS